MPLHHLLYRCPRCGHDPVVEAAEGARCPGCETHFERGALAEIRMDGPDGAQEASAAELIRQIDAFEAENPTGRDGEGRLDYSARVLVRRAVRQGVARKGRAVAGFFEEFDERREGVLRVDPTGPSIETEGVVQVAWSDVRAVQTSSKSLQINTRDHGLLNFEFVDDSPRRWESLFHRELQRLYAGQGQRVREFQPRITTEPLR